MHAQSNAAPTGTVLLDEVRRRPKVQPKRRKRPSQFMVGLEKRDKAQPCMVSLEKRDKAEACMFVFLFISCVLVEEGHKMGGRENAPSAFCVKADYLMETMHSEVCIHQTRQLITCVADHEISCIATTGSIHFVHLLAAV